MLDQFVEAVQDPLVGQSELIDGETVNRLIVRLEIGGEVAHGKLDNVPQLVAELTVSNYTLDVQVDRALDHVREKSKSKGVSSALRNTIREILFLLNNSLFDLGFGQVALVKFI